MFYASQETIRRYRDAQRLLDQLDPGGPPQALIMPGAPQPRGTIIVFPGSFNPPTTAHLAMLEQAGQLARTRIITETEDHPVCLYAGISKRITDKESVERPTLLDRIVLIDEVLWHHLPQAGVMLFNRGLYVEQAEGVRSAFPAVRRVFFLVGFDKIVQIFDPRYYEDRDVALRALFRLAEIIVAPRGHDGPEALEALLAQPENQPFRNHVHSMPFDPAYRQVSSTSIRRHEANYSRELLPEVARFIAETHAYDPSERLADGTVIDRYAQHTQTILRMLREVTGEK